MPRRQSDNMFSDAAAEDIEDRFGDFLDDTPEARQDQVAAVDGNTSPGRRRAHEPPEEMRDDADTEGPTA